MICIIKHLFQWFLNLKSSLGSVVKEVRVDLLLYYSNLFLQHSDEMLGKDLQWVYPNQEDHWKISFDLNICLCDLLFASHAHLSIWFSIGLLLSQLLLSSSSSLEEVFSVMRFRCREGKGARGDISYSRSYLAASSQRKPNFIYTQTPSERTCPTLSKYCVNMHIEIWCVSIC